MNLSRAEFTAHQTDLRSKESGKSTPRSLIATLHFNGQIRGGKNNIVITRSGHRFPRSEWARWRDEMVLRIRAQTTIRGLSEPLEAVIAYIPEDARRRDCPAVLDSLWHVLEKSGIILDDCLLEDVNFSRYPKDKKRAGATVWLYSKSGGNPK